MRTMQLMPGSGGSFYCENCLRDAGLLRALRALGHEPMTVPLYLPLALEESDNVETAPVFFGGINVFLQQKMRLFRNTPRWIDRVFDSGPLLRFAAKMAGMTDAETLAETTLSMLRGADGRQAKELRRMIDWLRESYAPDLVSISNALLLGVAEPLRREFGVPIVCVLQDEDMFVDELPEPNRSRVWAAMAERAEHVDAFIAVSHFYAARMREAMSLPEEKVHVVYNGIGAEGYEQAASAPDPPVIGYLGRLCPAMGFDILVEAFITLKASVPKVQLRMAGGWLSNDEPFLDAARERLAEAGVAEGDVEFLPNLQRKEKQAFLRSLSVLSVPARHAEAFGMYVLEALGMGVPVVVPRHGAFPELLDATGGGVLYEPDDPEALAVSLKALLDAPERARSLGAAGRETVLRDFTVERMAADVLRVYEHVLDGPDPGKH